ncbi:otu1, partial [Symbiodinium necroappetens]
VCAQDALRDPDPLTRALLLGFNSVDEYAEWIRNEFHWGGENEIISLAKHYGLEVAVVCCESMQVLCYGSDLPACSARIYILYTGQHYDPIVSGAGADIAVEQEQKKHKKGDMSLEAKALELARRHVAEAAKKAKQRRAKKIKCGGCGALLSDAEAFATHCGEVDHDDDFAYDCEEVEVVIEEGEELPEGTVDLNADHVYS